VNTAIRDSLSARGGTFEAVEDHSFSQFGERRVNVLRLNLALDAFPKNNAAPR
jgi:hypothetical protein